MAWARSTASTAVIAKLHATHTRRFNRVTSPLFLTRTPRNRWKSRVPVISNPWTVLAVRNARRPAGFIEQRQEAISMLMSKERRPAIRTLRGWAIAVLQQAGAIRECEEHGWMQDRTDPHARERAFDIARRGPPAGVSCEDAIAELRDVL